MTYFIYNKSGKRGLRLSINRFVRLNHNELVVSRETACRSADSAPADHVPCPDFDGTSSQQKRLQELLTKHAAGFIKDKQDLGYTEAVHHPLHTITTWPCESRMSGATRDHSRFQRPWPRLQRATHLMMASHQHHRRRVPQMMVPDLVLFEIADSHIKYMLVKGC